MLQMKINSKLRGIFLTTLMVSAITATAAIKVHTIGDSTMANYDESSTDKRGWCQMLQQFFNADEVVINNRGKSGASSKSFYQEAAYWKTVIAGVNEGDYVLIQFAHNDEKNGGLDGDTLKAYTIAQGGDASSIDYRGTTASGTFKKFIRAYIEETKAKGGKPIIVTPICRKYFSGNTIRRNGMHDLGDSFSILGSSSKGSVPESDNTHDYAQALRDVAAEYEDVPVIDLTLMTRDLYLSYGDSYCTEHLFCTDDSTHPAKMGATLIARLFAQAMKEQGVLAEHIIVGTDITFSPTIGDFGKGYAGQTVTKEFNVSAFGLSNQTGNFTFTVSEGFEVSTDKNTYAQSVSAAYTGGNLITSIYVRTTLESPGTLNGTLTATDGNVSRELPLTIQCIDLNGGEEVSLLWPLTADSNPVVTGACTAIDQSWSGMEVQKYSAINANAVWPAESGRDASHLTQRNVIVGGTWPAGEIDEVSTRYIQFGMKAPAETTIDIDKISLYVAGAGGSGMRCKIYYATDAEFSNATLIQEFSSMAGNTVYGVESTPVVSIADGESIYLRIYPWYSSGATGKTICLSDVYIHGMAKKAGATVENQQATITYAFDKGTDGQTGTYSEGAEEWFKNNYVEVGQNLAYAGVKSAGGVTGTGFQPAVSNEGSANEGNCIDFAIQPKNGLYFIPTKVSFQTTRHGTDGGKVDVSWVNADGTVVSLQKGISPARNNASPAVTNVSCDIAGAPASDGECRLRLNLYSLGNTKQVSFANVVIEGMVSGQVKDIPQYVLNVSLEDNNAGKLTVKPGGDIFSEGDEVTLSVEENFSYHFKAWVDAEGKIVSTENPYTFAIAADTKLTATFDKATTYALNMKVVDDMENIYGNANLVTIVPEGVMVDGVRSYEAGTDVKLTVNNNKILSFIGWEDGNTNAERIIRMDGEKNLTVNYAAADYIVAWDLYQDEPKSERAADYKSNPENAGLLSLRKADGTTSGWLTRGVNNGAEEGRWGARIWKLRSEGWYWEISFSTKGYSNITFSNGFGHSYNTYAVMKAEYSVDGTNFTEVGTYDIPTRGWVDGEFALPAEANNQDRVWIRWMPGSEELVGNETDYDGLSIGDIFVLGESEQANDQVAPVLVGSNPENNATGVSATGSIVLTFNERIKAGTGTATLNGEAIAPAVNGKTAVFQYTGLDYNAAYTFALPAGVITDRSGNVYEGITLNFTTMERTQPAARLYDAVVAADGSGDYLTVQEAIDAAPEGRAIPWLIFIKNGEYKGHVDIPKAKPYLHFIGQERDKVIITDDKLCGGDNALHVSVGATVVVNSNDCYFDNLTLENSWGHDKQAGPQALALNTSGDRTVFKNVAMLSYQDTWITPSTSNYRAYAKDCFIEGAVDFIYNSGNIYIDNTTLYINRKSGGYIVAPSHGADVEWGYVFMNCRITAPGVPSETDVWLGRPWHNSPKTVFINTIAEVTIPAKGWYPTMGGLPVLWADYNTMDGNGNPVDLSQREDTYYYTVKETGEKVYGKAKNYLTAEEAAQYTVKNVLSGSDNWQPNVITESCAAPVATLSDDKTALSWEAVPYAICYVVVKNGTEVSFTTETSMAAEAGADYVVYAANEQGGLSAGCNPNPETIKKEIADPELETVAIYTANGTQVRELQPGLNIVKAQNRQGNIITKKIIR